jgi:hypothetical protein
MSVHVLAEFAFCRRAGLNAFLDDDDDVGCDEPILRWNYRPSYEREDLESRLNAVATVVWQLFVLAAAFIVVGFVGGLLIHGAVLFAGWVAAAMVGYFLYREFREAYRLWRDYRVMQASVPFEPNPELPDDERVNWWALRAAGFSSQPCTSQLTDDNLGLIGRPWRILRKGDLAIPAYVRRQAGELKPQHRIRVAAYCHLVRHNEGSASPYGLVLEPGTFEGTAVKASPDDAADIQKEIGLASGLIDSWLRHGLEPKQPEDTGICRGCPHGRPRRLRIGQSETTSLGKPVTANAQVSGRNKRYYHSSCGDRFGWLPPHDDAKALELRPPS